MDSHLAGLISLGLDSGVIPNRFYDVGSALLLLCNAFEAALKHVHIALLGKQLGGLHVPSAENKFKRLVWHVELAISTD